MWRGDKGAKEKGEDESETGANDDQTRTIAQNAKRRARKGSTIPLALHVNAAPVSDQMALCNRVKFTGPTTMGDERLSSFRFSSRRTVPAKDADVGFSVSSGTRMHVARAASGFSPRPVARWLYLPQCPPTTFPARFLASPIEGDAPDWRGSSSA